MPPYYSLLSRLCHKIAKTNDRVVFITKCQILLLPLSRDKSLCICHQIQKDVKSPWKRLINPSLPFGKMYVKVSGTHSRQLGRLGEVCGATRVPSWCASLFKHQSSNYSASLPGLLIITALFWCISISWSGSHYSLLCLHFLTIEESVSTGHAMLRPVNSRGQNVHELIELKIKICIMHS